MATEPEAESMPDEVEGSTGTTMVESADEDSPEQDADPSAVEGTETDGGHSFWRALTADAVRLGALIVVIIALGAAVGFGIYWLSAAKSSSLTVARDREAALTGGELDIVNFYTMDYRDPQKYFALWAASSTGDWKSQVQQRSKDPRFLDPITQQKIVSTAKVLDAAVTDLEDQAGKATVIVAVDLTVTQGNGTPADKRVRAQGNLIKVGNAWLLNDLEQVPVVPSGQ